MQKAIIPLAAAAALALHAAPGQAQGALYSWPVESTGTVAPAGDVDGDGTLDFARGEPGESAIPGRVHLYSGLTGEELRVVDGLLPHDDFGQTMVALGDVDADGHDDLAVGAGQYVCVISGADGSVIWKLRRILPERFTGAVRGRIDDLDQDGVDDLLVQAFEAFPGGWMGWLFRGHVYVLSGASGEAILHVMAPPGAASTFGQVAISAGDLDFDGIPEILVSDPECAYRTGRVTVHSGFDGQVLLTIDGPTSGKYWFGTALASLGDVTGDGISDFVIASPCDTILDYGSIGRVRLHSGMDGATLLTFESSGQKLFGRYVAPFSDLDGDGLPDIMINEGYYHSSGPVSPADLVVHSSVTGERLYTGPDQSLSPCAVVPDVDGNGADDILLSFHWPGYESYYWGYRSALVLTDVTPPSAVWSCPAKITSMNCAPSILFDGAPSPTMGDDLLLVATGLPLGSFGAFFWSTGQDLTPFAGGALCLASPIYRLAIADSFQERFYCHDEDRLGGAIRYRLDKSELANFGLVPGETFYVQAIFRDAGFAPPNDVGLTSAIEFCVWP